MAGKITYLNKEEFLQQGEFDQFATECKLDGLVFRRGDTSKPHEIKQVLDTCNKYNKFDTNTLIIKGDNELTVWVEEKSQRSATFPQAESAPQASVPPPATNQQGLPTKTVTKRYRGQVYEETVVDWAAVQLMQQQQKQPRKYRGQDVN